LQCNHHAERDAGLKEIANLKQLTSLSVSDTQLTVTEKGLKELVNLKQLTSLTISGEHFTLAGVEDLRIGLPKCMIIIFPIAPRLM
jgi:hypothetical protein